MSAAIWPLHWLAQLKGALPPDLISQNQFPNVFGWINRFDRAVTPSQSSGPKVRSLKGAEAVEFITKAQTGEPDGEIDETDPFGLKKGQTVGVHPIDTGSEHIDYGQLVSLTKKEVVLDVLVKDGVSVTRLHFPRHGFRIFKAPSGNQERL